MVIPLLKEPAKCSVSTIGIVGMCFENDLRSALNFFDATLICRDLGGRLPTVGELATALGQLDGNTGDGEHSDSLYFEAGEYKNMRIVDGTTNIVIFNPVAPFRCVFDPLQQSIAVPAPRSGREASANCDYDSSGKTISK